MSGRAVGLQVQALEIRTLDDFERAFDLVRKDKITALSVMQSAPITAHQKLVLNLAAKDNLATMFADRDWPNLGGLMSYGPNYPDVYRQAATYVDKILRGAKPADLSVEQPRKFEFVINLKTAKQIGLTIPPNVLARANRVIR
jgi:putative tryptophan/tyrosine transport system substrate-binding protein